MFDKFKSKIAIGLTALTIALGVSLAPKKVESYNTGKLNNPASYSIHPLLAKNLEEFYPSEYFDLNKVQLGTIQEDAAESFPPYIRSFNHFTHWQTKFGLWNIMPSSITWANSSNLQSGQVVFNSLPTVLQEYYKELAGTNNFPVFPFGDHSWPRVLDEYENGGMGVSFGHVFHLIADLTVPAHVRSDAHWGDTKFLEKLTEGTYFQVATWPSDAYEVWTDEHRGEIMGLIHPTQIPHFNSLTDLMQDLAYFTGSHFYSDDNVDGTVPCQWSGKYCYVDIDGANIKVLRKGILGDFTDVECMKDMWSVLGTKAVEYGAGAMVLLEGDQPDCIPKNYQECFNEDLWWFNSCGDPETVVQYCDNGCDNGKCQNGTTCTDYDYKDCDGNEVWWFDSCGNSQEYVETCDNGCSGGVCEGQSCYSHDSKVCSGGNVQWKNSCGDLEEILEYCDNGCSNGECNGPACSDECDYEGQTVCLGTYDYNTCGNYDSDSCLEWGTETYCENFGDICKDGKCVKECACPGESQYCTTDGQCAYTTCDAYKEYCQEYESEVCNKRCVHFFTNVLLGPDEPCNSYTGCEDPAAICKNVCVPK